MEILWDNFIILLLISIVPAFVLDFTQTPKLIYAKEFSWSVVRVPLTIMLLSLLPSGILFGVALSLIGSEYFGFIAFLIIVPIISIGWAVLITALAMFKIYTRYLAEQELHRKETENSST